MTPGCLDPGSLRALVLIVPQIEIAWKKVLEVWDSRKPAHRGGLPQGGIREKGWGERSTLDAVNSEWTHCDVKG